MPPVDGWWTCPVCTALTMHPFLHVHDPMKESAMTTPQSREALAAEVKRLFHEWKAWNAKGWHIVPGETQREIDLMDAIDALAASAGEAEPLRAALADDALVELVCDVNLATSGGPHRWYYPSQVETARRLQDKLRAALSIRIDITSDNAIDHLPLAVADSWHLDFPVARGDAEFGASAEIVGDLGTVDHVLARGASDSRAGSREIPSLDDRHALPLRGQRPGEGPGPPATEHHHVVFLGM